MAIEEQFVYFNLVLSGVSKIIETINSVKVEEVNLGSSPINAHLFGHLWTFL